MRNKYLNSIIFILIVSLFSACELDERIDDLTGGYEGSFIDKKTNDLVFTEFYGAKLRLLDLAYGDVAQPLDFYALPNGTFKNTKVFPATYKIWAEGPFLETDTIQSLDLSGMQNFDIKVTPNVTLEIEDIKVLYGIGLEIKYSYRVNDLSSGKQQIGIVYSDLEYPGYRNSVLAGIDESAIAIKHIHEVTAIRGTITDLLFMKPNEKYYIRATGQSEFAGDYWNYSAQEVVETSDVDIESMPVSAKQGVHSSSSSVLQWDFPPIVDKVKLEYNDKDGNKIEDEFAIDDIAYVANLPEGSTTTVMAILSKGDISGSAKPLEIITKVNTDHYVTGNAVRPTNITLYTDTDFRYSLSKFIAEDKGPELDPGWITSPSRHEFIDWWAGWLWGINGQANLPTCEYVGNITEFTVLGKIETLVDILPFTKLEILTIEVGGELFSTGETVSEDLSLKPLGKLPNLKKVIIGAGVPLTQADFDAAGLVDLTIVKN